MDKKLYRRLDFPDTGISLYESKHLKGKFVSEHYHDYFQILYALEGEGEITLDSRAYNFSKDKVVLITPNCVHSIKAATKMTVLVLAFSLPSMEITLQKELLSLMQKESRHFELDLYTASEIRPLIRKMLYEQKNGDLFGKLSMPVYLIEIMIHLLRQQNYTSVQDANDIRSIQMKEYIERHYFTNITAESLSAVYGISTRYMNDIFKRKFNDTPLQYLQKVRINHAKELLLESDLDIVSICFEVGYETLSTFYRTFRNLVGISPNKFRLSSQSASVVSDTVS
ncbi:helix-turn-helix domain-containing protein [Bacillus sp. AG4(2022)]|uniref:helix-turn-helix domain-containing protein n=1 Tax=Bacillus sp. AG4(2022) TaxID=2962594 RepID=UPI0028813F5E|nr:helix-turn-helix domain-containing protein [Bacillus sp. AG4(2022)]MDT0160696.1 helix-turn-helix domain-containing protein [Bacillus sp. AG4(2022)]